MKICHINSSFDKFYTDFMEEQLNRGLDIEVFYFRDKNRGHPEINKDYLNVRLNYSTWQRYFFFIKENNVYKDFVKEYNVLDFNLLHAHTLFSNGYIAYKAYKETGVPYIVAVRAMDLNVFFKYRIHLRKLGIEILKNAERIIFISENLKNELFQKYVPENLIDSIDEKSNVIPNGINSFYLENTSEPKDLDTESTFNLLTVGHIYDRKNQLLVCKAIEHLIQEGYSIKYTIIGKILDSKYFNKVSSYNFVEHIPFISKTDLINYYNEADIFIMPSKIETFGLTYIEAMTQGLPVIYSKGQGLESYFDEGEVGYSVESSNHLDVASKIELILKSDYKKISTNAIQNSKRFTWDKINNQYMDIYSSIIKEQD